MCGLAGILRLSGGPAPSAADVAPALAAMAHRGPDGEGVRVDGPVALGHRRLALIDPRGGGQPMGDGAGRWIVATGEIYDYREERSRLEAAGWRFSTRSDTEVLLHLLGESGVEGLAGVAGMFAFARWDGDSLLLARDLFGMKPLLFVRDAARRELRFASEAGALFAGGGLPRIDLSALAERLAFQVPLTHASLITGVESVPPGRALCFSRDGRAREVGFAPPPQDPVEGIPEEEWEEMLRRELLRSVERCTRADAPLGVCLSGGLDSSFVAAAAARAGVRLRAFTGYFEEGEAFDERPNAQAAAAALGLDLQTIRVRPGDLLELLPLLARSLEGPVAGPGSLPQLAVARAASGSVRGLLNGQGADELFGGYARHRIAWLGARGVLDPARMPAGLAPYAPLARHLLAGGRAASFAETFFRLIYRGEGLALLLGPGLRDAWRSYDAREVFLRSFRAGGADEYRRMVAWERSTLLPALLHVEDRVTMSASVESRSPLLSPRILAIAQGVPTRIAFGDGEPKRIFRRACRGVAPGCALDRRDKMGFPVPLDLWARGPLRRPFLELLRDGPLVGAGILAEDAPERLLSGAGAHGRHLWFFLLLSEWMRETGARP